MTDNIFTHVGDGADEPSLDKTRLLQVRFYLSKELETCICRGDLENALQNLGDLFAVAQEYVQRYAEPELRPNLARLHVAGIMWHILRNANTAGVSAEDRIAAGDAFESMFVRAADPFSLLPDISRQLRFLIDKVNSGKGLSYHVQRTLQYIWDNYRNPFCLKDIATQINVNPSYLSFLFHKEMNVSFSAYVLNLRIEWAKRLLAEADMPLLNVALESGFKNQQYFTRIFRLETGMTPREFRQAARSAAAMTEHGGPDGPADADAI